jgi:tungstate transport system substrate-binding protein
MQQPLHSLLLILFSLCSLSVQADSSVLRMATTTSTDNSGLLKVLLPKFESRSGLDVQVLAVGTGQALRLGCNGDVDVVLVHAPPAEQKFLEDGCGVNRRQVMYNDFVIAARTRPRRWQPSPGLRRYSSPVATTRARTRKSCACGSSRA